MAYLAFYRTFRPNTFDSVVRQEHIVRILKNRIESNNIGHAYLFCGPRGTGKTSLAKIFARAINCEHPKDGSPCGECYTCKSLLDGANLDISEIDAASNNGVDDMRDLRDNVQYPPVVGKYKVYIIDEVHMLTASAFNAVLKTLEEPPTHAVFILATTEPQKIPATILSRCMRFDFKLIPQKDLEGLIKHVYDTIGKKYDQEAIAAIARAGAGSARDSLSIADMCASYSKDKLTYNDVNAVIGGADFSTLSTLIENILEEDREKALTYIEEILSTGKSAGILIKDMLSFLNNCAIIKVCRNGKDIVNLPTETFEKMNEIALAYDGNKFLRTTEILVKAENDMRYSLNPKITLETAILKCSMPQADYNIDALIGKINQLEKKLASGNYASKEKQTNTQATAERHVEKATLKTQDNYDWIDTPDDDEEQDENTSYTPPPIANNVPPIFLTEQPKIKPKLMIDNSNDDNPFATNTKKVQSNLFTKVEEEKPKVDESEEVFKKFIREIRTRYRNAVLFTLCMDLGHYFEGKKFVMTTLSDTIYRGLSKSENASLIKQVMFSLGITNYEVCLLKAGESEFDRALRELKNNFEGIEIKIK